MALRLGKDALQISSVKIGYWWDGDNGIHVEMHEITDEMLIVEI
jgi:hypothetical protein